MMVVVMMMINECDSIATDRLLIDDSDDWLRQNDADNDIAVVIIATILTITNMKMIIGIKMKMKIRLTHKNITLKVAP